MSDINLKNSLKISKRLLKKSRKKKLYFHVLSKA